LSGLKTMGVEAHSYQGKESTVMFLDYNRIPNLTVVVKKSALAAAGDFTDRVVAEEYEMWLQLLKNGCAFKSVAVPLSLYRVHDQSITARDRHATFEIISIIKDFAAKYAEYRDDARQILKRKILYWLDNGVQRSGRNFRSLIAGIYSPPVYGLLYVLSFVFKPEVLKKILLRIP
jgi:teichuronic acid biosynthesis glycosyltransferase TuaG